MINHLIKCLFCLFFVSTGEILFSHASCEASVSHYWKEDTSASFQSILDKYPDTAANKSVEDIFEKHVKELDELKDSIQKIKLLQNISTHYFEKGNFNLSIFFSKELIDYSINSNHKENKADAYHLLGQNFKELNNYSQSINYHLEALKLYDSLKLNKKKARTLKDIGLIFWMIGDNSNAENYFTRALEIARSLDDRENIAFLYNNLAMVHNNEGYYNKAMKLFRKSLGIKEKHNTKKSYANTLNNIGYVHKTLGNTDSSIIYYNKALPLYKEAQYAAGLANIYNNLALSFIDKSNFQKADYYLDKGYEVAEKTNQLNRLKENYLFRYRSLIKQKSYKQALDNYIKHAKLKDSLINREIQARISKIQSRHKIEQQNKKIEYLKKDKMLQDKKQTLFTNILIISGIAVLIVFFLITRNSHIKKKKNRQLEIQNREIKEKNEELKTAHDQLQKRKEKIEKQRNEIINQRNQVEEQFNIIQSKNWEITNSFEYASHIQAAILPDREYLKEYFDDYFILLRPRDMVSGDFYWFTKHKEHIIVATADCTGHGVAGGLMSMLGISFLNEIVNVRNIVSPEKILDKLREMIIVALNQKSHNHSILSGIDISIISVKEDKSTLEFAGANNPVYIIRNNELKEYPGDKMPISLYQYMDPFNKKLINIRKGDQIYMFTDGYTDQFGGEHQKKFKFKPFRKLIVETNNLTMEEQKTRLNLTYEFWKGDLEQVDDVLVMGLKI